MNLISMRSRLLVLFCFLFGALWGFYRNAVKQTSPLQGHLNLLVIENTIPDDVIEAFQAESRIQTKVTYVKNEIECLNTLDLNAEQFDLVTLMSHQISRLTNIGKLTPLQHELISNEQYISIDFKHPPYDSDSKYTIPLIWGINGYVLNKEKVEGHIDSLNDIFQNKYKKKIYIHNSPLDVFTNLFGRNKITWNTVFQSNIADIQSAVKDLKEYVREPVSDIKEQLLSGDVWIAQVDSGVASDFISNNTKFKYLIPNEGATLWALSLAIHAGTENTREAHAFLNYVLKKEISYDIARISKRAVTNVLVEQTRLHPNLKPSFLRNISVHNLRYFEDMTSVDPKIQNLFTVEK